MSGSGNVEHYTDRVPPADYEHQIAQHIQITPASNAMAAEAGKLLYESPTGTPAHLLDIGCGPGRTLNQLRRMSPLGTILIGIDADPVFIKYATEHNASNARLICTRLEDYTPSALARVATLMGVFHHVPTSEIPAFLAAAHAVLEPKGYLLVGDEFIPPYENEAGRRRNLVPWYGQVIGTALQRNHMGLAQVEALSLAGDLLGGTSPTETQVALCLNHAPKIWRAARFYNWRQMNASVDELLIAFESHEALDSTTEPGLGDVKRSAVEYQAIFKKHGFKLQNVTTFSHRFATIGGMANLTFRRV